MSNKILEDHSTEVNALVDQEYRSPKSKVKNPVQSSRFKVQSQKTVQSSRFKVQSPVQSSKFRVQSLKSTNPLFSGLTSDLRPPTSDLRLLTPDFLLLASGFVTLTPDTWHLRHRGEVTCGCHGSRGRGDKLLLTPFRTKVKRLSLPVRVKRRLCIDVHAADGVLFHMSGDGFRRRAGRGRWGRTGGLSLRRTRKEVANQCTDNKNQKEEIKKPE